MRSFWRRLRGPDHGEDKHPSNALSLYSFQNTSPPTDVSGFYQWSIDLNNWYAGDGVDGPPGGPTVTLVPRYGRHDYHRDGDGE